MTYFLKFRDPIHNSRTVKAKNLKFGTQIGRLGPKRYNAKLGQKVSCKGHVTYFLNFGTPFISRERLKLETLQHNKPLIWSETLVLLQDRPQTSRIWFWPWSLSGRLCSWSWACYAGLSLL